LLKKRDFIILFAVGVFTVILGVWIITSLVYNQIIGVPQSGYRSSGIAGAVFIFAGAAMISKTYQIFIPLNQPAENANTCPYCGAVTDDSSGFCEKCKNKLD